MNQSAAEPCICHITSITGLFFMVSRRIKYLVFSTYKTQQLVVTLSRKSCHITPILKELHWLPPQRIVFKLMLIVHKSVNNIAPIYISELLLGLYSFTQSALQQHVTPKEPTSKRTWGDNGLFLSRL